MMCKSHSLSAFLELLGNVPNVNSIINYAILTKHNYLLIFEGQKSYLISTESYVKDSYKFNDDGKERYTFPRVDGISRAYGQALTIIENL